MNQNHEHEPGTWNPEPGTEGPPRTDRGRIHPGGGGVGRASGLRRDCARRLCRPRSASVGARAVIAARLRDDVFSRGGRECGARAAERCGRLSLEPGESSKSRRCAGDGARTVGKSIRCAASRARSEGACRGVHEARHSRAACHHAATRRGPLPSEVERWMFKPRVSGGGHGVRLWQPGEPVTRGHYLQEFVEGTPGSVIFVARWRSWCHARRHAPTRGRQCLRASGFRYCGNILIERQDLVPDAVALVDAVAAEFSLVGVGSIDVDRERTRTPARGSESALVCVDGARRARAWHLDVCHPRRRVCERRAAGVRVDRHRSSSGKTHGKAIVFARQDVVIGDTRPWLEDPNVRDVPHEGEHIAAGQPICTVFAAGSDEGKLSMRGWSSVPRAFTVNWTQFPS